MLGSLFDDVPITLKVELEGSVQDINDGEVEIVIEQIIKMSAIRDFCVFKGRLLALSRPKVRGTFNCCSPTEHAKKSPAPGLESHGSITMEE